MILRDKLYHQKQKAIVRYKKDKQKVDKELNLEEFALFLAKHYL